MQKYFISSTEFDNQEITGDDVFHISTVMRARVGDKICVSDNNREAIASITLIEKKKVSFKIEMAVQNNNELPFLVDIYQGFPKGDKLDDIIKHSTELGVSTVIATAMSRSIVKIDKSKIENKLIRYNKIAKEASEQSNRRVCSKVLMGELKKIDFSSYDIKIVCFEEAAKNGEHSNFKKVVGSIKENQRVAVVIGPEGGISDDEIAYLKDKGFEICGLGPRILRTETASMYVLSSLSYEWELK